jgi:hypothetical protein
MNPLRRDENELEPSVIPPNTNRSSYTNGVGRGYRRIRRRGDVTARGGVRPKYLDGPARALTG